MIRIDICYIACRMGTQTLAPNIPGFQVLKRCIQYMDSHPHKHIFNPSGSNYELNTIRLTSSGNQVEGYTIHNFLEFYQYADHDIIISIRRLVSGIVHTLTEVTFCWKVYIPLYVASESTDGEIIFMYNYINNTKSIQSYMKSLALNTCAPIVY